MSDIVWFITGASSGFGEAIANEALRRGHKVVASARDSSKLGNLKAAGAAVLDVDVTSDDEVLAGKLAAAAAVYGRITHVANCAGYILEGAIEEASAREVAALFNTNVLGTFNVSRAAAKHLRAAASEAGGRHQAALATFGSLGSWGSGPAVAHYCSTKWAVSGMTEGLAEELGPFGIDVCVVEPGYTRTGFLVQGNGTGGGDHRMATARQLDVYDGTAVAATRGALNAYNRNQPGDVDKCAVAIVDVLTRSGAAEGRPVPVRLVLGTDALAVVRDKCAKTLALLDEWEAVSASTMFAA
ncbi:hypothetical protein B0T26DRAFT_670602 [Lasiosphaeria miniovina]|uniref:Oxidoreductase n=1 Tax=Lasiosphaeria miniovina TaxID=1954250 RepID=A0AA40EAD5_9PEZI|nr:uncharacterized protein B0T26DRAFT_670602 [Lasiosphaeria miniovina]KAK0734284.1 hypothetical protein B0T26DRAFT_670602 [Lasiosphaeria miniovina]